MPHYRFVIFGELSGYVRLGAQPCAFEGTPSAGWGVPPIPWTNGATHDSASFCALPAPCSACKISTMRAFKRLSYFFLPVPFAAVAVAEERTIRIGYAECVSATNYPAPVTDKISQLKWYFAHASVGANMIDGITDLHAMDKGRFSFQPVSATKTPPATTQSGAIYEHNRGNPGWKAKFDQFESCVSNGWHYPAINLAMNKLCYIDQHASFKYYLHSMTNLEAVFPETIFVYTTMPLMTDQDSDNFLRNAFNDRLREWTRQNGRVLFDIADIEAHDPNGKVCTFQYRNKTCQKLCDIYTRDGGHLNEAGRQLVAKGFYALAAALAEKERAHALSAER